MICRAYFNTSCFIILVFKESGLKLILKKILKGVQFWKTGLS